MTSDRVDLRLAPVALAAWGACAFAVDVAPSRALFAAGALAIACGLVTLRPSRLLPQVAIGALTAALGVGAVALAVSALRAEAIQVGPLPDLARQRAQVVLVGPW